MCENCTRDPRDLVSEGEIALGALAHILSLVPPSSEVPAESVAGIVALIHEKMHGSVEALQAYVPRDWTPSE